MPYTSLCHGETERYCDQPRRGASQRGVFPGCSISAHYSHSWTILLQGLKINVLSDKAQCCKFQTHRGRFRKSAWKKLYYHKESSHLKFKEESSQSKRFLSGAGQIKINGWVTWQLLSTCIWVCSLPLNLNKLHYSGLKKNVCSLFHLFWNSFTFFF